MSALLETRSQEQIDQEADAAVEIISPALEDSIESFGLLLFVKSKVRQAYLMGRHDSNARTLDELIKTCRSQAEAKEQA